MPTPRKSKRQPVAAIATAQTATAEAAPSAIPVSAVDRHHEDYDVIKPFYTMIGKLYRGGYELQQHASQFLRKRPVEPPAVYTARTEVFTYQNVLQAGLGFYTTTLYTDPPEIFLSDGETEKAIADDVLDGFLSNCDRCGTSLLDASKQWLIDAALNGAAYVLIDLPGSTIAANFREQKQRGDLNAYLIKFDALQVINWSCDQAGNYEWIVIATKRSERVFGQKPKIYDQWYYFDRTNFVLYESQVPDGTVNSMGQERMADVAASGRHALADQNRVPVRKIEVPNHLWLAYRVYLQVLDHLNQDNAFSWALQQANLAVPVITGPYEDKPVLSETAYIHLPDPTSKFGFAEQTGNSFTHAAARVAALREEIYRQMHLQAQGRSSSATASANSGYSKEMDMAPSKDVANAFGDLLRSAIKGVVEDAALIANRQITAEVSGLEAEDDGAIVDIAEGQAALDLGVPSDEFDKYIYGRVASRVTRRAPPVTKATIQKQIAASPSRAEIAQQQQQNLGSAFEQSLDTAMSKSAAKNSQQ